MWVYRKIYHEPGSQGERTDELLSEIADPLTRRLLADRQIDQHHFLRYADPRYHLRLRFKIVDLAQTSAVEAKLRSAFGQKSLVKLIDAAYEPETDKYGGEKGLSLAERWFTASSELVYAALRVQASRAERCLLGAGIMLDLLKRLQLSASQLHYLLERYRSIWLPLCSGPAALPSFESSRSPASLLGQDLERWELHVRDSSRDLFALMRSAALKCPLESYVLNMAHLTNNRLGLGPGYELALVDLLKRGLF